MATNLATVHLTLVVVVASAVLIWLILKPDPVAADGTWPFEAKRLLSDEQAAIYKLLQAALPGLLVFPGVALGRMLYIRPGGSVREAQERTVWKRRLREKVVDFVVCDQSAQVLAVVDIMPPERLRSASRVAQVEKERALRSARVPVVHWSSLESTDLDAIRKLVLEECS